MPPLVVDTGAFVFATGNTFSHTVDAPTGDSAIVSATAVANWADGALGGQSADDGRIAPDCATDLSIGRFTGGGPSAGR